MARGVIPALATVNQRGVLEVGVGLQLPTSGKVDAVRLISDLWIDPAGNDTNGSGSISNPFATLTKAFQYISDHPLAGGYTVHLPSGVWEEAVGLPPPKTRLVGQDTALSGPAGAMLEWGESADAGPRLFEGLRLSANITGRDGGDLSISAYRSSLLGTLTRIGSVLLDGCADSFSSLINCSNVTVRNPVSDPSTVFALTYDPTEGANGSGAVYNEIVGGLWDTVQYDSTDATVPLYVRGARVMGSLLAYREGYLIAVGSTAVALESVHADSHIAYDGFCNDTLPAFHGLGSFSNTQLLLKKTITQNFGSGDVVLALPKQASSTLKNVFMSTDVPGISASWVSSTDNSVTIHLTGPLAHPAYELRILLIP